MGPDLSSFTVAKEKDFQETRTRVEVRIDDNKRERQSKTRLEGKDKKTLQKKKGPHPSDRN